jgi:hypothetical protein
MNNIYNIVNDMDVAVGTTVRTECPSCGQRTFTVTNEMGTLKWNCFRASCTVKGSTQVSMSIDDIKTVLLGHESDDKPVPFALPEYIVTPPWVVLEWASELYGLDAQELGLMYDVKDSRVVFPIRHDGQIVDATGRALDKSPIKWKRYGKSSLPYVHGCGKTAVVVEDCVSAAVVGGDDYVGVAVLGTSLLDEHKRYLTQFSTAIIALDPDALMKSIEFARELQSYVDDVRVVKLTDDLKYRNPEDFDKLTNVGE